MQLAVVCLVLAAAAVPGGQAAVDLFCDCRVKHHLDWTQALHCTREQSGTSEVSCRKGQVSELPRGYYYVRGYALVKLYRTYMIWEEAKKTCGYEGAQLAIPPHRYAVEEMKQLFSREGGIWFANIGITDEANEGVFMGIDGRPAPYLNFSPNGPNNNDGRGGPENCVDVNKYGITNDVSCVAPAPFFCERRLSVVVPDSYTWLEEAGRFYNVHTETLAHAEAATVCRSEKATLAVTDTWRRALALLRTFDVKDRKFLIGFTDEATEGDFVTESGRHLKDMEFQVWGVNEPNNHDGGKPENCLALSSRGYYNDVRCDLELPFICEIAPG